MKIPQDIADKVLEYQAAREKEKCLWKELIQWFNANTCADSINVEEFYIAEKPSGKQMPSGEYCEQHEWGDSGDSFYGNYYHQIDGSNKYVGFYYTC